MATAALFGTDMMSMSTKLKSNEIEFTTRICNEMREVGAFVIALTGNGSVCGMPDRLVIHRGFMVLIEFKGLTTKIRTNQLVMQRQMKARKWNSVFIVREPNEIVTVGNVENNNIETIERFAGTGVDLLDKLSQLCKNFA